MYRVTASCHPNNHLLHPSLATTQELANWQFRNKLLVTGTPLQVSGAPVWCTPCSLATRFCPCLIHAAFCLPCNL